MNTINQEPVNDTQIARLVRANDLCKILGVSRSTLWRMEKNGILPEKISITGARAVGWRSSEINDFVNSRKAVSDS